MPMTQQEVFDKVCEHLMTQMERCASNGGDCLYRDSSGRKCAFGALIPDALYKVDMEHRSASDVCTKWPEVRALFGIWLGETRRVYARWCANPGWVDVRLIDILQSVHDKYSPDKWKDQLIWVAEVFQLEAPECLN